MLFVYFRNVDDTIEKECKYTVQMHDFFDKKSGNHRFDLGNMMIFSDDFTHVKY